MNWVLAHFIGDFILQTDWMSENKKRSSFVCFIHVLVYMFLFLFTGIVWWKLILIAVEHFIQDRWNMVLWFMQIKGTKNFATNPVFTPWSLVITDAIMHISFIYFVTQLNG